MVTPRHCRILFGALLVLGCPGISCAWGAEAEAPREGGAEKETPQESPIPEIPKDQLPRQTRPKPDPTKDQFAREPVFVWIEEKVQPKGGELAPAEPRVVQTYLQAYLQRAGFPVVESPKDAALLIEGTVELKFHAELTAFGRDVGWKYRGQGSFLVRNPQGQDRGSFEIPEVFRESVKSEESAALQARRYVAKVAWDNLFHRKTALSNQKVEALLNALAVEGGAENLEREGYVDRVESTEEVVNALADVGFPAVPYLLEAMTDDRPVRMPSSYPGVADRGANALRVFHIADKALEEIFQKVSRLGLDTEYKLRMLVLKGWEHEWKRFCPPFAQFSKQQEEARRRLTGDRQSEGPAGAEE
jgi:hypothetical protein